MREFLKRGWFGLVAAMLSVAAWISSCGSCATSGAARPPELVLRDAVVAAHTSSLRALEERVELVRAQLASAPAPRQALVGVDLSRLVEAVRRYAEAVRRGEWQEGLVPALREAAEQYEAVRLALGNYVELPPLPRVVEELLIVECR